MVHSLCRHRTRSSVGSRAYQRRIALLASCAFAAGALALWATTAMAGCNSGNDEGQFSLDEWECQARAPGNLATAVGTSAQAGGEGSSAYGWSSKALGARSTA